jgi:hypothetical protein
MAESKPRLVSDSEIRNNLKHTPCANFGSGALVVAKKPFAT